MSMPAGVHSLQRWSHEERILRALQVNGPLSRGELAKQLSLSRTTLSEVATRLLQRGALVIVDTDAGERRGSGRPAERLALDPASGQFVGVDFGHRQVHVAIAGASHDILASDSSPYTVGDDWPERVAAAFALIDRMSTRSGVHFGAVQGVALGVTGRHDERHQIAIDMFAERFGTLVLIDNNTRFAALAEAVSAGVAGPDGLVFMRISDGIGGGLVVGGRLVRGSDGTAGELGHVIVERNGAPCRCGKRGCLETIASAPAILAACRQRGASVDSFEALRSAVSVSDPVVDDVLRDAGAAIGRVLGMAALAINPSQIVVGGEILQAAPALVERIEASIRYEVLPIVGTAPTLRAARHADNGGALGAIEALFHQSPLLASYPDPSRMSETAIASSPRATA